MQEKLSCLIKLGLSIPSNQRLEWVVFIMYPVGYACKVNPLGVNLGRLMELNLLRFSV